MRHINKEEQEFINQMDSYQDDLEIIRNKFVSNEHNLSARYLLENTIYKLNKLGEDLVSEIIHDYERER
tara:strand:+ start:737 stop:943 length:207 start_codon:yes stop_codon:yes gene_type:complete